MENPFILLWEAAGTGTRLERLGVAAGCGFLALLGSGIVFGWLFMAGSPEGEQVPIWTRFAGAEVMYVIAGFAGLLWVATLAMVIRAITCPGDADRKRGKRSLFERPDVPR